MSLKSVLLVLAATAAGAQNLELVVSNLRLPSARAYTPASYDGQDSIYIWGGYDGSKWNEEILKLSVTADTLDIVGSIESSQLGSGVWAGNETLLYFGGYTSTKSSTDHDLALHYYSDVWNFKTNDPSNWTSVANLPQACSSTSSVWDGGENTYIIGGFYSGGNLNTISRYNSVTHAVDIVSELPVWKEETAAIRDNSTGNVYIFGGWTGFFGYWNDILKFDPADGTVMQLDVILPVPSANSCAVWTGKEAYVIGGIASEEAEWPQVVRFDPQTNQVTVVPVNNFPEKLYATGCAFVEKLNRIYIFGGRRSDYRHEIMYIDLNTSS